ncbi:MAG: hypothetical protein CMO46_10820 [Verrucomicrobiales bacterium]|nr:hypothetical protein [Verrucomicrobiales bacterium]|tara:strand:- start:6912 stop:7508 length:597 start_codon:yes stop_codon:yes gene_type:complete
MLDIKSIVDKLLPVVESHRGEEHIEIEMRLGKHNGSFFDTNVGKDTFDRVMEGLHKYNGWEKVETSELDVYYSDPNHIRLSVNKDTGENGVMIQKINVLKDDFSATPFDMRFSVSREIPTWGEYDMDRVRTKTRHSFIRKNLSIDMTISSGDNADMDAEEDCLYQIEFEIIDATKVSTRDEFFNIVHKVNDLSKLIPM